ncbi:glycosyltransferase family 2 protein [Pseudarthrobacter phenanthrenivorans]|uniref:glycosyltransferase family 2 protein n=1 Tax=Pseudarthrobacter phenanthrenivorans TaxID=361575 RepID=UPI001C7D55B2|nr:glycosyltransferase family A protein [Pseudarthrobacter phenanthrenivorans]
MPTVSVVISCYNYARYLTTAVQSCISQQEVTVEVIIVDDASTDDSLDVARSLSRRHANVSVISHAANAGPVGAFNDGARLATGEFLVRLDADDILTPGSLGRAALVAQSFPSVGLVYGHPLHFSTLPLPKPRLRPTGWTIWPGSEWLATLCRSGKNVITSPEVMMRRSLVAELGYMSPLAHSHDMELWLRLSAFADVAYIHGADQAWHREHSQSLSARSVDNILDFRERVAAFDVLFGGPAGAQPDAASLRPVAQRTLAREALRTARHELARGTAGTSSLPAWLELARTIDPVVAESALWSRLQLAPRFGSLPAPLRFSSLALRLRGRIRSELEWYRWHRKGVY